MIKTITPLKASEGFNIEGEVTAYERSKSFTHYLGDKNRMIRSFEHRRALRRKLPTLATY